jgi:hypothetical protein
MPGCRSAPVKGCRSAYRTLRVFNKKVAAPTKTPAALGHPPPASSAAPMKTITTTNHRAKCVVTLVLRELLVTSLTALSVSVDGSCGRTGAPAIDVAALLRRWQNPSMKDSSLNRAQRVVFVIGLALALYVLGGWLTQLGSRAPTGWVGYAPLSSTIVYGGLHPWVRIVIWLLLIAIWVAFSTTLLKTKSKEPGVGLDG